LKLVLYDSRLLSKSKTTSEPISDQPIYENGSWKVQMRKPKREIVVVGCNTEGEVIRKILLMGHPSDDIKDIIQL
jgi:hypothetical protein